MNSDSLEKWEDSVAVVREQSAELNVARQQLIMAIEKHIREIFVGAKSIVVTDDFSVIEVHYGVYSDVFLPKEQLGNLRMDMEIGIGTDHQMYSVVVLKLYPFGRGADN